MTSVTSTVRGGGGLATEVLREQPYVVRSAVTMRQVCTALRLFAAGMLTCFPPVWSGDFCGGIVWCGCRANGICSPKATSMCARLWFYFFVERVFVRMGDWQMGRDHARRGT